MATDIADTDPTLVRAVPAWSLPEGEHAITEFTSPRTGALSPFGDDIRLPLPHHLLRYEHPTALPNR